MREGTGNVLDAELLAAINYQDGLAKYIADRWVDYINDPRRTRWREETAEVKRFRYATDTGSTSNRTNPHSHTTHLPKLAQIGDTLEAHYLDALFPHDQWVQFVPGQENENTDRFRNLIEEYIRNRHRLSGFHPTMEELVRDWVDEGNCFAEVIWSSKAAREEMGMIERSYIGPTIRRLDPARIGFNFDASSFGESWKVVQSVKTTGDIASEMMDETLPGEYREVLRQALEFRMQCRTHHSDLDTDLLNAQWDGFGNFSEYFVASDLVETLTFYGSIYDTTTGELHHNRKIAVIDRKWVLMDEAMDTWDGKPMIYHCPWRRMPNSLLGMGPLQNLTGIQYMINHLQNVKADAFDDSLRSDRVIKNVDDIIERPDGTKWFMVHDQGDVRNLAPDAQMLSADYQIAALERKMEEYAGVPPEAFGFKTPGEQTKFEVSERLNASARLFQHKTSLFERQLVEPVVQAELELAKRNVDENLRILVSAAEGDIFEDITQDALKNKGTYIAVGARHFAVQARYSQELSQFMTVLQTDPEVAMHFPPQKLAKAWASLLGSFGEKDGVFEPWGRLVEQVEAQQRQQAGGRIVDNSAIAMQSLDDPEATGAAPEIDQL